ncbi:hypothetical protein N5853_09280 [Bartonella sp. HY329]|uniref:hypothetical protein n=1 Tax=unclassified Bartonella TaxID=2645622 RepID=UPI0021CA819F|nr:MULTISPECIES: hypothetical protein [unclassified Bartonella]UXM94298.1 hypothetical protein N5853_09280 [Bartonella sp. HY329]UXN08621.1 hypothetical protein N5852_09290 [Bartonella sp. HY328]
MMNSKSAKGLFRATGKIPKTELTRERNDFYPTPPEPILALLKAEHTTLIKYNKIWEPAAGDGAMAKIIREHGFNVRISDLIDRGCGAKIANFYSFKQPMAPAIITNPPFSECNKDPGFVRHALEVLKVDYMALLLPFIWPGSARERGKLWADYPPYKIYMMRWRIDFTGQGNSPVYNAWFVWQAGFKDAPMFHVLDRPHNGKQAVLNLEAR